MAYESNSVTFIGNLTDDPQLRRTSTGTAVASFRVASNRRYTDRSGNQQEETTFMTVNVWRDLAENVASSVAKGDRVMVVGRIRVRSWEQDGTTRWSTEIEADDVAPSLRWATAAVTHSRRDEPEMAAAAADSADQAPPF